MRNSRKFLRLAVAAGASAALLATSACQSGSLTSSGDGSKIQIRYLYSISADNTAMAEGMAAAFNKSQDKFEVVVESRPGGTEGDNLVKTRLSTGEMTDVFQYNSGSLMRNINPAQNLLPLNDEPWASKITEPFQLAISVDDKIYGAPWASGNAGGIMYNKKVYSELGLSVPKNWAEFMANNEKIKAAGKTAVLQSYGTTWTSQLFLLGDFVNVVDQDPNWAEEYTNNKAKYANPPALEGFEYTQQVYDAGYINSDAAAMTNEQALAALANGEGVHYPILSSTVNTVVKNNPDKVADLGFFGIPGLKATENKLTTWVPNGMYIPTTTTGDKLEGAKKFVAFAQSSDGCKVFNDVTAPNGPYGVTDCQPKSDVPGVVTDIFALSSAGKTTAALEFVSPIKGPNLESIIILVGTGQTDAKTAAAQYDEDVKKQAQQLGLPGW